MCVYIYIYIFSVCVCISYLKYICIWWFIHSYIRAVIQSMLTNQEHKAKDDMMLAPKSLNFNGMFV